jgi:hypothetical protein
MSAGPTHRRSLTGDDCIALKSSRNDDRRRVDVPIENVRINGQVRNEDISRQMEDRKVRADKGRR